jgi:hypothetical protein
MKTSVKISVSLILVYSFAIFSCAPKKPAVTPEEMRAIIKEAYIYGFPMVDNYRIFHAYFIDESNAEFKAPLNELKNVPRVYTHEDKAVQTPNSDTPYSLLGLNLIAEPMVLTVPKIGADRYFSVQFIDAYTFNFDYAGSRTTGNDGGVFLVVGPNWRGETPEGITKVIKSETEFVLAVFRTQLFNPADIENVKAIQDGYKAQPLSAYLGKPAPEQPQVTFTSPITPDEQKTSPEFFRVLNFVLQYCPVHPSETELMAKFNKVDLGIGLTFDYEKLSPELKQAVTDGMADARMELENFSNENIVTGKVTSGDIFGTREYLKNNYLYRFTAAVLGIYGNSKHEAMYPVYKTDSNGQLLEGTNKYVLTFGSGQFPPVNAFWSLTMYELPASLLVENPLNRYLINSTMLSDLKKNSDGGITLYIQNESPGTDKESNWLPAPKGPFAVFLRLYWPKDEALNGTWKQPNLEMVK